MKGWLLLRVTMLRQGLLVGLILLYRIPMAHAQLSPGDLHASHAFLEGLENCGKCHNSEDRKVSEQCLECHTLMREQLNSQSGLHGREKFTQCELCHVEHHGREFELIWWKDGQDTFDHGLTGYRLDGAHTPLKCRACHTAANVHEQGQLQEHKKDPNRTFLGLSQECADCHFDEHRAQFKDPCSRCHTTAAWKPAPGFVHDTTDFPLTGKHRTPECRKCHETITEGLLIRDWEYIRYAKVKHGACTDCHEDTHKGKLGRDCADCHNTDSWKLPSGKTFDHQRTRYPLVGMHAPVECAKCHKPGQPVAGTRYDRCVDCHKDYHHGAFAERPHAGACDDCHTVFGFTPAEFPQQRHDSTDYPLLGAHRAIACFQCHKPAEDRRDRRRAQFMFASTRCLDCHANLHGDQLAKLVKSDGCEFCHRVDAWQENIYDHGKTKFPLEGRHLTTTCRACHRAAPDRPSPDSLQFFGLSMVCADCHSDIHRGQFAGETKIETGTISKTDCKRCHTFADWRATGFDHDRDSQYKLAGAHKTVLCDGCHKTVGGEDERHVLYRPLDAACKSCHGTKYSQEGARP